MSNSQAIAAVTTTLHNLLDRALNEDVFGTDVTTRPPDRARDGSIGNQVNLFLYHTEVNASWRNRDIPGQSQPGQPGRPPLPLNLYYLVTAYGDGDDEMLAHRLLGQAMSVLHDFPLLEGEEIRNAEAAAGLDSDLDLQVERVRIRLQPLTVDEMSRLWTGFQSQYRVSAAYEVAAVLIESTHPSPRPLPVLRRGSEDRGVHTRVGPFPTLESLRQLPEGYPVARLGDSLRLQGRNLGGDVVEVRFDYLGPAEDGGAPPVLILPAEPGATARQIDVVLPDDAPEQWAPGVYQVAVITRKGSDPERVSNALPLPLAPAVTVQPAADDSLTFPREADGSVTLTLDMLPPLWPGQRAALLLGEESFAAPPLAAMASTIAFTIADAPVGDFVVRLRVDGIDSLPVISSPTGPAFDPDQEVTIT